MDFEIGDRICKVRGINSGKSGTIRSVLPNGTVGVVFDGEKTVRYCDPGNCAKPTMIPVATNAKFKVGQKVKYQGKTWKVGDGLTGGFVRLYSEDGKTAVAALETNVTATNAKFRKGDVVYLGGVEKMEVMAPTDAHGWTKCKYLEGSRKGMVIDMPTPELKSAKNACAANASVKVRPEIQKEYDAYVKAKEKFDKWWNPNRRFSEGGRETLDLHEAEKALWTKWRSVFGTPIPSGWAGNPSVLANAKVEVDGSKLKFTDKTGKWHGPFKNWDELEREMGKYGISLNSETVIAVNGKGFDYDTLLRERENRNLVSRDIQRMLDATDTDTLVRGYPKLIRGSTLQAMTKGELYSRGVTVNETSYNADRRHGRDLMAKHMGTGFVQSFEREKGGSSWKKLIDDAKKALASRDAADIEAYIMSIVRNSEAEDSVTNAATDAEFEKIKAMGKTAGDKYFRDNYQSFIDKYGFKDALELGKRISRIKYKPIKKGRFAGKGPDGMTYYVDYTNDRWFAKKYGKDGTNVTEIQIQGPWVKDPDGKDRRHILYLYGSGSESIHPANPAVAQLVKQIMRGPDVLKQDAADYAWNEEVTSSNPVVANALKAARNAKTVDSKDLPGDLRAKFDRLNRLKGNNLMGNYDGEISRIIGEFKAKGYKVRELNIGPHTLTSVYYDIEL